jgi:amino acid adenylation domain-containing protein
MSNTGTKYTITENDTSLCAGFLFWLQHSPDAPALHINDTLYTYQQLFDIAIPVYEELKKYPKENIGIYCTPDVYSYASILAISLAGGCYVPLNVKYPNAKLRHIIRDCELELLLVHGSKYDVPPLEKLQVIDTSLLKKVTITDEAPAFISQHYAYILYTSGTTGEPKGVQISKRNVNAFFGFFLQEYDFNPKDRFLQPYELSFDVSVFSVFCAWNAGASVYVVKDTPAKYLEIFKTIQNHGITVASMVPGVLKLAAPFLQELHFPALRYSFFSGDALYQPDVQKWKPCIPNAQIHNFYGPTETTIVCTRYCWDEQTSAAESHSGIVPLGKVFPGMHFILVDEAGSLIDEEDIHKNAGELCFNGEQVIDKYVGNRSAESFFEHNGKTWYKTGDWASVNKQGDLIFRGRHDTQVKINGYRVELAEIEKNISLLTKQECKVIMGNPSELPVLIAFVEGSKYTEREMRNELSWYLPSYMLPSKIIFVEAFPKNENGKTDMNKLKRMLYA